MHSVHTSLPASLVNMSEATAYQAIKDTFGVQYPSYRLLANVILRTGDVRGPATSEYDLIFVCPAGVFVFEVKGWSDGILKSEKSEADGQHSWWIERSGFEPEYHRDPVSQGGYKVRYLVDELDGIFCTQYALFTAGSLQIDPHCNAHAIHLTDLPYLSRVTRATARKHRSQRLLTDEQINAIAESIEQLSKDHTPEQHLANVRQWAAENSNTGSRVSD